MRDGRRRVLYMEDDPAQARLVRKCLERAGYCVDVAPDGQAGLNLCAVKGYDALLVDQTMPLQNGLEVIRALAARGALPPTIMVTGTGNEQIAVEAMKLGLSDYLVKDLKGAFLGMLPLSIERAIQHKRLEQDLARAQKLEAIGRLAAGIAHEINTPIQYIGDNLRFLQDAAGDIDALLAAYERLLQAAKEHAIADDLLAEIDAKREQIELDYLREEAPKAVRQSLEGVQRVAGIVGAMKEFSHPGSRQKQAVDLNHAIESTLTVSRNEWKYVADAVVDFEAGLPPVLCLPSEINQAVLNLVVNAAHAIGQATRDGACGKGTITLRTRRDGDWVEIRVQDTGPGIPQEIRDRVFDPFFTTKDVGQGSGQGLAIVHSIVVDRHGGTIGFHSEMGRGTTFILRLPIGAAAVTPVTAGNEREMCESCTVS